MPFKNALKVLVLKHVRVRGETLSPKLNQLPRQFLITLISQIVTKKEAKDQIKKYCVQSEGGLCLTWISDGGVGLPHPDRLMQRPTTKVLQRFQNFGGIPKFDSSFKIWMEFQNLDGV